MKSCLSISCLESGCLKLIGYFCRDAIGCKTQVDVSGDWSVSIRR